MTEDGCLTIRVTGFLDADSADELPATVGRYTGITSCVVDLSLCDSLDSSGIRALLMTRAEIDRSAEMALTGVRPHIQQVLRLAGVDRIFEIYAGEDRLAPAVASVNGAHVNPGTAPVLGLAGE